MTESKYKIIPINQSVHTDHDDDGEDEEDFTDNLDEDTVTIIPANDSDDLHFPNKFNDNNNNNMQTPTGILTLILIYFILSIGLTFYQRNLLKVIIENIFVQLSILIDIFFDYYYCYHYQFIDLLQNRFNIRFIQQEFHFPFTVVLYHLLLKLVMAGAVRYLYRCYTGKSRVHIDWRKSFRKLAPTGIAAGIDIGFSNWGLELVTISLCVSNRPNYINI